MLQVGGKGGAQSLHSDGMRASEGIEMGPRGMTITYCLGTREEERVEYTF